MYEAGEKLSHAQVKEIITGHKRKPPASNMNRKPPDQAQASSDVANEPTLFDWQSLPQTRPERTIDDSSSAEQKLDVAPPVAPTDPAPSPDPVAALVDNTAMPTTAGITAKEEPKPVESTPPPDPIILSVDADLDSVDRAIDVLYSRWRMLALRVIEKAIHDKPAIGTVKAIHDKAAGLEMQSHLAKNTEASAQARAIRLWAVRRLGRWLIDAGKKGHRFTGRPPKGVKIGKHNPDLITLNKLGISKQESKDWQKIARLSDAQFEALLAGKPGRCHLPHYRRHRVRRFRPRRGSVPPPATRPCSRPRLQRHEKVRAGCKLVNGEQKIVRELPIAGRPRNVLGDRLEVCSLKAMTGFFRDGCCDTSREDIGSHTVCAVMTAAFLEFTQLRNKLN